MIQAAQRRLEHWLFDLPEQLELKPLRWIAVPLRYLYALLRDLFDGELGLRAMGLVYSTLFALVPTLAVGLSVLKLFGYHAQLEIALREFVRPLGDRGVDLIDRVMGFVDNVQGGVLGTIGFAFLLISVASMIQKIEEALNFVWHVRRPHSLGRRVTQYMVVMLVAPVIAVSAMVLLASFEASAAAARIAQLGLEGDTHRIGGMLAPYALTVGLFFFLYVYLPNTRVRLLPALVGAAFGGILWAAVGALFARIVVYFSQTMVIYAGFAVVLLFLVWLHLSWLITLLGAQLSFYVQHPEYLRTGQAEIPMTGVLRERLAMSVMYFVGRSFAGDGRQWTISDLAEELAVPGAVVDEIVSSLERRRLVVTAENDAVLPARALDTIGLDQIMHAIRHDEPDPRRPDPRAVPAPDAASEAADQALESSMTGRSLRELVED